MTIQGIDKQALMSALNACAPGIGDPDQDNTPNTTHILIERQFGETYMMTGSDNLQIRTRTKAFGDGENFRFAVEFAPFKGFISLLPNIPFNIRINEEKGMVYVKSNSGEGGYQFLRDSILEFQSERRHEGTTISMEYNSLLNAIDYMKEFSVKEDRYDTAMDCMMFMVTEGSKNYTLFSSNGFVYSTFDSGIPIHPDVSDFAIHMDTLVHVNSLKDTNDTIYVSIKVGTSYVTFHNQDTSVTVLQSNRSTARQMVSQIQKTSYNSNAVLDPRDFDLAVKKIKVMISKAAIDDLKIEVNDAAIRISGTDSFTGRSIDESMAISSEGDAIQRLNLQTNLLDLNTILRKIQGDARLNFSSTDVNVMKVDSIRDQNISFYQAIQQKPQA